MAVADQVSLLAMRGKNKSSDHRLATSVMRLGLNREREETAEMRKTNLQAGTDRA